MAQFTPMMQQYLKIKKEYKDAILFFRLGDFYEMFFDDALVASRELEITLTSREAGKDRKVPMCGVPYHAADGYIGRLIAKGYKVAICEQVEDPKSAKGIVRREVVRVITPGTVTDSQLLEEKKNNYLVAITEEEGTFGLAYTDISTGDFRLTEIAGKDALNTIVDELARLQPAECLLEPQLYADSEITRLVRRNVTGLCSCYPETRLNNRRAYELLIEHFQTVSLEGFGCEDLQQGIRAAATLLLFLQETQKSNLRHLSRLVTYFPKNHMVIDAATRRNLELVSTIRSGARKGTLLWVLDQTLTAMGGRLLRQWIEQPLLSVEEIRKRQDAVEALVNHVFIRHDLRSLLKGIYDLERLITRISYGNANARDLLALKQSLSKLPAFRKILQNAPGTLLQELYKNLDLLSDVVELIEASITDDPPLSVKEGGIIRAGYNSEVDKLREAARNGKHWIAALEAEERERTGIKSLKVGYNKVFGYYIEVTKPNLPHVPDDYIRKQTLANAERFITSKLKEYENLVLGAEERAVQLEYDLFVKIREEIASSIPRIQKAAQILAQLDVLASLAEVAATYNYCKPKVNEGDAIYIKEGRHPVVERVLEGEVFVPNDTYLDCNEHQMAIITGPNMAGKSTYMRQVALITLMAQMGSFVPAREAEIGIVDRIFTRVGAADDLATGQSTFMVEMNEVSNILHNATRNSLIILDEIGRGTSTYDGVSIAWAVAEYLLDPQKAGAKTLFATHYHQLNRLAELHTRVKNYRVAVKEKGDDIIFLRQIVPGGTDRSYGIQVARLAGLPQEVIRRAKEILHMIEAQDEVGTGLAQPAAGSERNKAGPVKQLEFFSNSEVQEVINEIKELDILSMTPLDAINKLYELQIRIRKGRH